MQETIETDSHISTGLDLKASPDEHNPIDRNKTIESAKESGLGGLKKKTTFNNRYLIVWINSKENDAPVELQLELPNQCTVQDCIALSLKTINNLLSQEAKDFGLNDDPNLFHLYISKKNGMPKTDYPPFDMDQKLNETSILTYTLMNKSDAVYKFKDEKKNMVIIKKISKCLLNPQIMNGGSFSKGIERQVVFSNRSSEINVAPKKNTSSECGCLCFKWLFKNKSKDVLLEERTSSDFSNDSVKNSGI